ncbi:hypothetical protein AB9L13_01975 [Desulfovibrio piger]
MLWKMPVTSRTFWGQRQRLRRGGRSLPPNEDGWTGLFIITELLKDLLTRTEEEV